MEGLNGTVDKEVEEKTLKELVRDLPERIVALIGKAISFKGLLLGVATWLVIAGYIETYAWLIVSVIVLFGRDGLKFLKEIKK
jgi:hypothetical protein